MIESGRDVQAPTDTGQMSLDNVRLARAGSSRSYSVALYVHCAFMVTADPLTRVPS